MQPAAVGRRTRSSCVRGVGVLGIFDEGSVRAARPAAPRPWSAASPTSPAWCRSAWSQTVVVYALSNTAFLATLPGLPGGDPSSARRGGVPGVRAPAGRRRRWSPPASCCTRGCSTSAGRARDRLVRHELTHVAIGEGDDHAPVWLSEGLAEYVSVQPLPPEKRTISEAAIDAARAGVDRHAGRRRRFNEAGTPAADLGQLRHRVVRVRVPRRQLRRGHPLAAARRDERPGRRPRPGAGCPARHQRAHAGPQGGQAHPGDVRPPEPEPEPTEAPTDVTRPDRPTDATPDGPTPTPSSAAAPERPGPGLGQNHRSALSWTGALRTPPRAHRRRRARARGRLGVRRPDDGAGARRVPRRRQRRRARRRPPGRRRAARGRSWRPSTSTSSTTTAPGARRCRSSATTTRATTRPGCWSGCSATAAARRSC